jgi:hypothetical protein
MLGFSERIAKLRAEIAEIRQDIMDDLLEAKHGSSNIRETERSRRETRLHEIMDELKELANPGKSLGP